MHPQATATMLAQAASIPLTWNPADKAATISLSNGDRTATLASGSWCTARATSSRNSGKWFFESVVTGGGMMTGVTSAALNVSSQYVGAISNSISYQQNGNVIRSDSVLVAYPTYGIGAAIGVAIDFDSGKIWFGLNGSWVGDPATTSGGLAYSPSAPQFPGFSTAIPGQSSTLRPPTSFAVPSGFLPWQ